MKKCSMKLSLLTAGMLAFGTCHAADGVAWSYLGEDGPENWGSLATEYATCKTGKNRSPVNITDTIEGDLPSLELDYKTGGKHVINNGHTVQINYVQGSDMQVGDKTFELKQFHVHAPSENAIDGKLYPMDAHFVHADEDGNLAVIGLMFEIGEANAELEKAWQQMPSEPSGLVELTTAVNALSLMPEDHDYYRFNGSLTTPPCSEGVSWFVMKEPVTASREQIEKFSNAMKHPTNRPVQPINARLIVE